MKLSREAIQRMVGDRVGGGGGAGGGGGISMDDIQGMGFATQQWVGENYLSIAFFSSLFKAYTSQMVEVVPNAGDVSTIENIKAMFGFWTEQYVSSLGYNSSGGGGGDTLTEPLASINSASLGMPTAAGQVITWNGTQWIFDIPQGGGGGGGTGTVTSITAGTGLSGGTITMMGTIAISSEYQGYISHGEIAYGWGDHAEAGYATQQWVGENYLSIAFFSSLFKAYTSQMAEVVPNGGDVSTIENIKAMFGFWTEQYVSSLGYNSSGGGGGGADLNLLLDNINDSNIGNIAPTASEVGKCLVYNGNNTWAWATPGGGGGGTGTVTSITAGTGLSGGTITTSGTIAISSTYQTYISDGETAYGWGNHANAGYLTQSSLNGYATQQWADQRYVTIGTQQYITAQKTFTASLIASNDIYLNKYEEQQWVNFNNGLKNFSFGQEQGGDSVLYASGSVNFYTNINSIPYALFVQGSTGNVGIGNNNPTYKFDVSGNIHTNSAYYLDGRLFANNDTNNNNGLHIGYGFAAADLPTTLWGDEISFRSIDGTFGECTTIGNKYGIMGTDFIGVTNKFRFEYDSQNNTVWVLRADGSAVHFASLGGVSSLGTSSSGTPNISSMNLDLLTATTGTIDTLNATELKVGGSGASAVKKIYWDGIYLQVQIGSTTYKFRPDATA